MTIGHCIRTCIYVFIWPKRIQSCQYLLSWIPTSWVFLSSKHVEHLREFEIAGFSCMQMIFVILVYCDTISDRYHLNRAYIKRYVKNSAIYGVFVLAWISIPLNWGFSLLLTRQRLFFITNHQLWMLLWYFYDGSNQINVTFLIGQIEPKLRLNQSNWTSKYLLKVSNNIDIQAVLKC